MGLVFTKQISNTTFVLGAEDGIRQLSVKNSSATAQDVTIIGSLPFNGIASAPIILKQGGVITLSSQSVISGVTITSASAAALADIIATQ
tara:strand:+ start:756 stop:1025 length:270 start_codon:yes stop_codon:yes gene_type:complete